MWTSLPYIIEMKIKRWWEINKVLLSAIAASSLSVYLLVTFVFSPEKGENEYYKQYLQLEDNSNSTYKHSTGKVDAYVERMQEAIASNTVSNNPTGEKVSGDDVNSSGTPNTITGDFTQESDGFTAQGVKINVNPNSDRGKVVAAALSLLGIPYEWGGTGNPGYDCSGFVQAAYKKGIGMDLPRVSGDQCSGAYGATCIATTNEMKPGDIAGDSSHVVMYLGNGYIIESPCTGKNIRIISMQDRFGGDFPVNEYHNYSRWRYLS